MVYVYFTLWIAPHACLGVAIVVAFSRRIHKRLPFFFSFMVYEVFSFVVGFACYLWIVHWHRDDPVASMLYHRVHLAIDALQAVLQFATLYEIAGVTLFSRVSFSDSLRRLFRWAAAGLLLTAVVMAATLTRSTYHLVRAIATLEFAVSLIQIGLLLSLLLCTRLLGVSWRSLPAGIALGFGLRSSMMMAASALSATLGRPAYLTSDLVQMGAFQVCAIVWLVYISVAERQVLSRASVLGVEELETLGKEMRRLTGDSPGLLR